MQIQVVSDLHLEFHPDGGWGFVENLNSEGVDVLVIAGDISSSGVGYAGILVALSQKYPDVVLVSGNHDYYGVSRGALDVIRGTLAKVPNVHWLHNSVAEVQGQRFLGTPLWFRDDPWNASKAHQLSDFMYIPDFSSWVYEENSTAIRFLEEHTQTGDIVATHHLPSAHSVAPVFKRSDLNCFFVCDMERLIVEAEPAVWIHGHTHSSTDYELAGTRVVCNPYGYFGSTLNPHFDPRKIVEVE